MTFWGGRNSPFTLVHSQAEKKREGKKMTVAIDEYDGQVDYRIVPIKYIAKLAELESVNLVPHEPVVDRYWCKDGTGYTCIVIFRWLLEGQWEEDEVHFQMNLEK